MNYKTNETLVDPTKFLLCVWRYAVVYEFVFNTNKQNTAKCLKVNQGDYYFQLSLHNCYIVWGWESVSESPI